MTAFIRRRPLALRDRRLRCCWSCSSSFPIVPETKQAVIVRFGKPVRILNRYQAGRPIGAAGAGIRASCRSPSRSCGSTSACQDVDMQRQQVLSTDQRRLRSMPSRATGSSTRC